MRKKTVHVVIAALSILLLGLPSLLFSKTTEQAPTIVFIFDASGSMWGRIQQTTKIEAARNVMDKLLSQLPNDVHAGLVAYGHRRKGDCKDIEIIIAPKAGSGQAMRAAMKRLNPKGKTPIASSLSEVGQYLRAKEGESTIVLVSDGIETCGGDPCAVARALREQGIKLVIHVVGFDVSRNAEAQLRCIAGAGGGRYFRAETAEELAQALTAVSEHVIQGTELPEPPPPPKVKTKQTTTKRIKIAGPGTVVIAPAPWVKMPPYYWMLVDPETGKEVARSKQNSVRVKAGTYQIVWRQQEHGAGNVLLTEIVTVESGKKVTVPLETGVRITAPEGLNKPYFWRLEDTEKHTIAQFRGPLKAELTPAGTYRLIWRQTEHGHSNVDLGEISIQAGKLNEVVLDQGINVILPDWLPPPYYYLLRDEKGKSIRIRPVGPQIVAPGTYELLWRQTQHGFNQINWGTVTVAEEGFTDVAIDSGILFLAGDAPAPYRIIFEEVNNKTRLVMSRSWGPMPLPPGTYKIDLEEKQHQGIVNIIDELTLKKGQLIELEM